MAEKHAERRRKPLSRTAAGRRPGTDIRFPFTYRCPEPLVKRLDEARWALRAKSRTALVTDAIEAYLNAKNIPAPDAA